MAGCATQQAPVKTTSLAPRPAPGQRDAYGYAPVRITAFADGSRIAVPSDKPDLARLTEDAQKKGARLQAAAPLAASATATGVDPAAEALKADVAERQRQEAALEAALAAAGTKDAVASPAADAAAVPAPTAAPKLAADAPVSSATAGKPIAARAGEAVASTVGAVGDKAEAVTVAALDATGKAATAVRDTTTGAVSAVGETTGRVVRSVSDRIGDTFGGEDTITGDAKIDRLIETAAAENGIPPELAYAVVRVESHYNPQARGSGVYGLSQIKPATARGLGFSGPASALLDPETNLRYGMKYLAGAWEQGGGDVCQTAMKYKGGHRTTRMTTAAATYCSNVKRHMAAIERRRAPANGQSLYAANERRKTILMASRSGSAAATGVATAAAALPGVTVRNAPVPVPAPIAAAAASAPAGEVRAATALLPAPTAAPTVTAAAADSGTSRGGRVRAHMAFTE